MDQFELTDTLRLTGGLIVDSNTMRLGAVGPDRSQALYFYEAGNPTGEQLLWNDASDRFEFSDDLYLTGQLQIEATTIRFNVDGPDQDQALYFYDNSASSDEQLRWDDSADEFIISDDLLVQGMASP